MAHGILPFQFPRLFPVRAVMTPSNPPAQGAAEEIPLTRENVIKDMGAAPHNDLRIFGRLIKLNSTAYKAVIKEVESYQDTISGDAGTSRFEQIEREQQALRRLDAAAQAYDSRHRSTYTKGQRREVMRMISDFANSEYATLETEKQGLVDDFNVRSSHSHSVEDARAHLQLGMRNSLNSANHILRQDGDRSQLSGGVMNDVYLGTFTNADTQKVEPRVLKILRSRIDPAIVPPCVKNVLGLNPERPMVLERNVATAKLAEALGLAASAPMPASIYDPQTRSLQLAMVPARGEPVCRTMAEPVNEAIAEELNNPETRNECLFQFNAAGIILKKDEATGQWMKHLNRGVAFPYIRGEQPETTASLQKGLLDLQVLHALTGQIDGHAGNIFVHLDGDRVQVTGIDHDLSFPEKEGTLDVLDSKGAKGHHFLGMPPLLSRDVYDHLMSLDENALSETLTFFPESAIASTKTRLRQIQTRAREMDQAGLVVDDFATWTKEMDGKTYSASDYLMREATPNNYVRRAHLDSEATGSVPPQADRHSSIGSATSSRATNSSHLDEA